MKESFLIHLLIASCGVLFCDAEASEASASLVGKSIYHSKHVYWGDKASIFENSSPGFHDALDSENSYKSTFEAPKRWTRQSGNFDNIESPAAFSDDTTLTTTGSPVEGGETTTEPLRTTQPATDDTSTTMTEESTTTVSDKGE